jgi:hypothetical protein
MGSSFSVYTLEIGINATQTAGSVTYLDDTNRSIGYRDTSGLFQTKSIQTLGTIGTTAGDWQFGQLMIGSRKLFYDANGMLRVKFGTPTNDSDGSVIAPLIVNTTANRPTTYAIGREFFDTTLGKPIWCKSGAEVDSLQITAGATTSGNINVTLNGATTVVAVSAGDSANTVASKIASANFAGWTTSLGGTFVTFTATLAGTKTAPSISTGSTGATGTFTVTTAGTNPVYVDATGATV